MRRVPSLPRFPHLSRSCGQASHARAPSHFPVPLPQPFSPIKTATVGVTGTNRSHMTRAFSQPSFSRSQSWGSQARSDTTVEDSEPERQERRLKLKAKTTRRVKRKKTGAVGVAKGAEDVIELTDSSPSRPNTPVPRVLNAQRAPLVIIDVSGESGFQPLQRCQYMEARQLIRTSRWLRVVYSPWSPWNASLRRRRRPRCRQRGGHRDQCRFVLLRTEALPPNLMEL